jgi:hypothetical protein
MCTDMKNPINPWDDMIVFAKKNRCEALPCRPASPNRGEQAGNPPGMWMGKLFGGD